MTYQLQVLPATTENLNAAFDLCAGVFKDVRREIFFSNFRNSHPTSFLVGAMEDSRLVAVNGFLGHDVLVRGAAGVAYQSCWSATDPAHSGRGLFRSIIEFAIETLKGRAPFMFGFPNAVSEPIFVNKLQFSRIPMRRVVVAVRGPGSLLRHQFARPRLERALEQERLVRFDARANHRWKAAERDRVVEFEHYNNYLWGRIEERRRFGARIRGLIAGGVEINRPQLIGHLLERAGASLRVAFIRFLATEDAMITGAARLHFMARSEPYIYRMIDEEGGLAFDAHVGLKDAY